MTYSYKRNADTEMFDIVDELGNFIDTADSIPACKTIIARYTASENIAPVALIEGHRYGATASPEVSEHVFTDPVEPITQPGEVAEGDDEDVDSKNDDPIIIKVEVNVPEVEGKTVTKSQKVRACITAVKAAGGTMASVIAYAMEDLGMTKALATTYTKNNWDKA